jgi:hypothetical protein
MGALKLRSVDALETPQRDAPEHPCTLNTTRAKYNFISGMVQAKTVRQSSYINKGENNHELKTTHHDPNSDNPSYDPH